MNLELEDKIKKLLKDLADAEPDFITVFDINNNTKAKILLKDRMKLVLKYKNIIEQFEADTKCTLSIGPLAFVIVDGATRYIAYFVDEYIQIESQTF